MNKGKLKYILPLLLLALIGVVIFWKTFQLEIFGDEWEGIWWTTSTLQRTGHFNDRVSYKPYEAAAILLNMVSGASSLNYNSTAVYVFSFITRLFAAYSLYYFFIRRKLSLTASFIGALLFLITPIGIQATDWAKNFTSYISIAFFLICIDTIFDLKSWKRVFVFLLTFLISVCVNPIRAHGILLVTAFLLFFQLFFQKMGRKLHVLFSFVGLLLIFFTLSKVQVFGNENIVDLFGGDFTRFRDLFLLIGRGILPQPSVIYICLFVAILLFWKRYLFSKKYLPFTLLFHISFLFFFLRSISSHGKLSLLLGIYFVFCMIWISVVEIINHKFLEAIYSLIPLLLNIGFIFLPWILGRTDITDSTHRYLIYPALSIPIIVAFSVNKNQFTSLKGVLFFPLRLNSISFFTTLFFLSMFFLSIKSEINNMYLCHNQETAKIIWQQITPFFDGFDFKDRRPIILFESDNAAMLHDTVLFGLGYHLGYLYKIWDEDKLPIPLDGVKTLKSMLTDGKASKRYTGKEMVFPKEDAFYFRIEGNTVSRIDIADSFTKD